MLSALFASIPISDLVADVARVALSIWGWGI